MYTLTEITKDNNVSHHEKLGERFSVIDREISPKEFERTYNVMYGTTDEKIISIDSVNENLYCLIVKEGGQGIIGLTKGNFYYIVTENGQTFKNLTFK